MFHEEVHGLPALFGWVPVLGKLEEGAEASDLVVDGADGFQAVLRVAHDPAVVHEVGDGDGLVGHGLVVLHQAEHAHAAEQRKEVFIEAASHAVIEDVVAGFFCGLGDMDVEADAPVTAVGDVAAFGGATLVGFPVGMQVFEGQDVGGEGNPAVLACPLDGGRVAADAGDADGRVGLLVGLEPEAEADVGERAKLPSLGRTRRCIRRGRRIPKV